MGKLNPKVLLTLKVLGLLIIMSILSITLINQYFNNRLEITSKEIRISTGVDFIRTPYIEGKDYTFDEAFSGDSNVASIHIGFKNRGYAPIKDILVKYNCGEDTAKSEICANGQQSRIGKSLCSHQFLEGDRSRNVIVDSESQENKILLLPRGGEAVLSLHISPVENLNYYWPYNSTEIYHKIYCRISLSSVENEFKEDVLIRNYLIKTKEPAVIKGYKI